MGVERKHRALFSTRASYPLSTVFLCLHYEQYVHPLLDAQRGVVDWNVVDTGFKYERIDKDNAVLLVVDHQEGLFQLARDRTPADMKSNILAHAALGKVFGLPTILTTSAETGASAFSSALLAAAIRSTSIRIL